MSRLTIGVKEFISLPDLGLDLIAARIDTGAKTSSLHVDHIEVDKEEKLVKFWFHPDSHDVDKTIKCACPLFDTRWIKSSNGEREKRHVIRTIAKIGTLEWEIELTLTDRSSMQHLMLIGREALSTHFLIDPAIEFAIPTN